MVSRVFVPPPLGKLRLASVDDATAIWGLVNESMANNFRVTNTPDIIQLVETSVLSIIQLDCKDKIVGFLSAKDFPLIPSVHPRAWEEYIWTRYKAVEMNARNTLFIHLMCWSSTYAREVVDSMLKSIFMHDPYVMFIAMIKSLIKYPLLVPGQSRCESSFRRVTAMERGVPGDLLPVMSVADRGEVCPRLRIRRAVEEDNDDLVPIIEHHSARLREIYGEFYISELISRHPESERVLMVCEHKELAVGLMILNTEINFGALEENFELSPFSGLRHLVEKPVGSTREKDKFADSSMSNMLENTASLSNLHNGPDSVIAIDASPSKKSKAVAWINDDNDSLSSHNDDSYGSQTPAIHRDVIEILEEDDEEIEFDIVNIDTNLLRVPKMISYESHVHGQHEVNLHFLQSVASYITKMLDGADRQSTEEKTLSEKEKYKKSSAISLVMPAATSEPVRFMGHSNAFLLEIFAMHADYDERYGFDMLEVAFELFPNRDYCVLCLPSNHTSFPLLEHFTLVSPYSSRKMYINESLYVAHINSVRGNVSVRSGEAYDIPAMNDILEHAPRKQILLDLFQKSLITTSLDSFVLLSQNQPIGMVILGPLDDPTIIRRQYDLEPEPRVPGTDGAVLAGVMSPVLEPHSRWFIRDLLRLSNYTTLFWLCRLMARGDANPGRNLMSLAGRMTPVRPRRAMPNISGCKDLNKLFQDMSSPFALWVLERPLTSLPKVDVNNGIVVVGASRTGLAFLEALLMGPTSRYLTFTNVTLISEHGLPMVAECLRAADTCVPRDGRYTDRYLKSVPFTFYVDVVSGVMTGIDRKKKFVSLKGGGVKYYDELVLTCGHQFQHPDYLAESLELVKELEKGKTCERMLMDDPQYQPDRVPRPPSLPENVIIINSLLEANLHLRKLLRMISELNHDETRRLSSENRVLVYGDCVEAYSCMAALLELGIAAEQLAFVEPFPDERTAPRVNCFNNEAIDNRVQNSLEDLGINVYRCCRYTGWRVRGARVVNIKLMSRLHALKLPCFALFYYGMKAIDIHAFRAINECGLVYDGGLVVGPTFDTNDPHVYAAGTCVRYSRRLYSERRQHRYYCSEDVGEALAQLFLRRMDPFVMGDRNVGHCPSEVMPRYNSSLLNFPHTSIPVLNRAALGKNIGWQPVKKYESPIVQFATLPGPLYYLKVRKPGPEIPMEVELGLPHQGHTLLTDKDGNYIRLKLNVLHCVDAVTCLSKKRFYPDVLSQLYGKHEAFFNKLLARYMLDKIDDLYEFFVQSWMQAIYQESFEDLLTDINQQDVGTVYDVVKSHFSLFNQVEEEESKSSVSMKSSTSIRSACSAMSSCATGPKEALEIGTFRSVIDRYISGHSITNLMSVGENGDIPSECGQSAATRNEAKGFWTAACGERIVNAHIARYLDKNMLCNPHYAAPKPELI